MIINCLECGTKHTIPEPIRSGVNYRCASCGALLKVQQKTQLKEARQGKQSHVSTKLLQVVKGMKMQLAFAALSLIGVMLVLESTSRYGVGIAQDSIAYISCAKSLLSGTGYSCNFFGQYDIPFVLWPPLFPTLLAGLGKLGIDPLDGARFVNAVSFGLVIFTAGNLFKMHIRSASIVLIATACVLFSVELLTISVLAWSESLFTLLAILFVICLSRFLNEKRSVLFWVLSFLAALACLERYLGITLIATGFAVMVSPLMKIPLSQKLKYAIAFTAISATPLAIWLLRNYAVASTFIGDRDPSMYTFQQNVLFVLNSLSKIFLPEIIPLPLRVTIVGFGASILLAAIFFSLRFESKRAAGARLRQVWPVVLVGFIYISLLIVSASASFTERIDSARFIAPIYVFVVLLAFIGVESASNLLKKWGQKRQRVGHMIVITLCALWLFFYPFPVDINLSNLCRSDGIGYNSVQYRESPLIKWVQTNRLDGLIYSNAPDPIYFLTGITARASPVRDTDIMEWKSATSINSNYLVWFNNFELPVWYYDLQELSSILKLEKMAEVDDGAVFLIASDGVVSDGDQPKE